MSINPNSHVPIYLQIADHIRRALAAGVYRTGEPIPSLRQLALQLVVNPNTVQRAFEELEREGLIHARKGLGMFVTEQGAQAARTRSEDAVYSAFSQGIRAGRAARMPSTRIRDTFERAWTDTDGEPTEESDCGPATSPNSAGFSLKAECGVGSRSSLRNGSNKQPLKRMDSPGEIGLIPTTGSWDHWK